jgi:hypothetical protein
LDSTEIERYLSFLLPFLGVLDKVPSV